MTCLLYFGYELHRIGEGRRTVMSNRGKSLRGHVKFTKYDHRPYVEATHLVKSENFKKIVKKAAEKRRQALGSTEDFRDDQ